MSAWRFTNVVHPRGGTRYSSSRSVQDYDILVVGGGVMGASVAYHTALSDPSLRVCVVERDTSYAHASAVLSAGGIRQCVAAGRIQDPPCSYPLSPCSPTTAGSSRFP